MSGYCDLDDEEDVMMRMMLLLLCPRLKISKEMPSFLYPGPLARGLSWDRRVCPPPPTQPVLLPLHAAPENLPVVDAQTRRQEIQSYSPLRRFRRAKEGKNGVGGGKRLELQVAAYVQFMLVRVIQGSRPRQNLDFASDAMSLSCLLRTKKEGGF